MKKIILSVAVLISIAFAGEKNTSPVNFQMPTMDKQTKQDLEATIKYVQLKQKNSKKIDLKTLEYVTPLFLDSVRLWANIHEEDITSFTEKKLKEVTSTKEFYGIHMVTYFKWCKLETNAKTAVICIDKDYLK